MTAAGTGARPTDWLRDAVVYEIYPQSFADSDGDGIGDMPGVLAHLDHLAWLGVDTIWFNPCFDSPFHDAGYDVRDYLTVAPRYGTNDDLVAVVDAARERGIRVLLDLVAGHTSDEHAWFVESCAGVPEGGPAHDRYVWSDVPGEGFVASPGPRPGYYLKNFYDSQPALSFGYADPDPAAPWQQPADAPGPQANQAALREVMAFWLDRGVAGFRVDMAFSLVKGDPGYVRTMALWRGMRAWLDEAYPEAVLLPEGVVPYGTAGPAFHGDMALVIHAMHSSLFDNGGAGTKPWWEPAPCYFDAGARGSLDLFLREWQEHEDAHPGGAHPLLLASADHDFSRLVVGDRTVEQTPPAWVFLLTWGTVPSVYYGDEIGIAYRTRLPEVEGSICHPTYNRAGARTPMHWGPGPGAGFSTAPPEEHYLPVDPDPARPDLQTALQDPSAVLHLVRELVDLRRRTPALRVGPATRVLHRDYPLVYERGGSHVVVVNPSREPYRVEVPEVLGATALLSHGVRVEGTTVHVDGFGCAVLERA
ncbi:alpha-amylase family glycosyl hydrolase [Aquipuribacter hungaricus]|uniref:Alpha-amylase family glycosyl hydrolase n=1 Tax=Aquipuribacter hungaricus TaxID=545624 RepID=A0ABV7WBP7_9MICO